MKRMERTICIILSIILTFLVLNGCKKSGPENSVDSGEGISVIDSDISDNSSGEAGSSATSSEHSIESDMSSDDVSGSENVSDNGSSLTISESAGSSSDTVSAVTERKLIGNTYTTGFPIVQKKETIKIMTIKTISHGDFDDMRFTSEIEKKMNIDIIWDLVPEDQQAQRKLISLMSGALPDIYMLYPKMISDTELNKYAAEGTFLELGSKLSAWAPNIKASLEAYPKAKVACVLPNGKIYSLPNIAPDSYLHYWNINTKWLKTLGLNMPKTTSEFYNVLKKFKFSDPNGNGLPDEIPFQAGGWHPSMWAPWGLSTTFEVEDMFVVNNSGKVKFAYTTENSREAVKFWGRLYTENIITDANLIASTHFDNIKSGRCGVFIWPWPYALLSVEDMKDYEPFPFPDSQFVSDFKTPTTPVKAGTKSHAVVTKTAKNKLETVLRFLDYFYTPEGWYFKSYADPGYKYYDIIDGKFKMRTNDGTWNALMDAPGWVMSGNSFIPDNLIISSTLTDVEIASAEYDKKAYALLAKQEPTYKIPSLVLTAEETAALKKGEAWFGNGPNLLLEYISGQKNIVTDWNNFLTLANEKGLAQMESTWQQAYDRAKKYLD